MAQYESQEKTRINSNLDDFKKQLEQNKIATEQAYDLLYAENIHVFQQGLEYYNNRAQEIIQELKDEYNENKDLLDDFKAKRNAINQEIMRQRELEEQQDFYSVQLSQNDIDDIQILNGIRSRLNKITVLDKLIYDMYVSKPVNEMIKRVLKGEAPSGIYKITRLKTGEIYIGKSTDIKSRW